MKKLILSLIALLVTSSAYANGISGTVQFKGTAPAPEPLSMSADPTCAAAHSEPVYSQSVIVNDNGTLRNVFVYVKEGLEGKTFETPKESIEFDQKGCMYTPHVVGAQVGQKIQIMNSDNTLHNVHSLAEKSKQFNLGMPIQGMKLFKQFDSPEIMVKMKCDVHPWMSAYIGVLPHPYFSVTDNQGNFSIESIPAGDYVIEAWHETYGTQTQSVSVAEGEQIKVSFEFGV
ncbi:MAG: hypothetical protein COV74_02535 [Candidatus Omnitrophica bacterium CG11_big_fil_rev_8_21_14_0_20_45_26]|uniref:Rhamnogalacturonan lyase domain-containing protein n=1 Tax=Candidatus Abzuiibacterium crystallinum TaxID=1974748 RepID=A0A2H0LRH0_9BACT|nr:MAG: hypothetical protein COV74_02535 [Candidatus Omnitrophica bacterium CG11_big_fil_rev_8_21_14_0_20_45_26]PIW65713.1 MAG: hypothetical protein COW12_00380 [Candidatus Omnitrophica bacterium CG12_big_fil_rev_8_21_14_0_65_45_16]